MISSLLNLLNIKRSFSLLFIFLLIFIGVSSYIRIAKENYPDISIPVIFISAYTEGLSAEDGDSLIALPIIRELRGVDFIDEVYTTSSRGAVNIRAEFLFGADMSQAKIDIDDIINSVSQDFPEDTNTNVNEINTSEFPILNIYITNRSGDLTELYTVANNLETRLSSVPGVSEAQTFGKRTPVFKVILDINKIQNYGLSLSTVVSIFRNNNISVTTGSLDNDYGTFDIDIPGTINNLNDILEFPITTNTDNVLKIKDIASFTWDYSVPNSISRLNGEANISIQIINARGENVLETIDNVKENVEDFRKTIPDDINIIYSNDTSKSIRDSFNELVNTVILTSVLVLVIVILALNVSSGILVSLVVPFSFLIALSVLFFSGYTLNIILLIALILSVGMIVDSGIVIVEYADKRIAQGMSPKQAFITSAEKMMSPIFASSLTTIVVFLPLLFWPGLPGEFMFYFPLAIPITLGASFFVATIILPIIGGLSRKKGTTESINYDIDYNNLGFCTNIYSKIVSFTIRNRKTSIFLIISLISLISFLYYKFNQGLILFPETDPEVINIDINVSGNLSLHERDLIVKNVEVQLRNLPDIENVFSTSRLSASRSSSESQIGRIELELVDWQDRSIAYQDLLSEIRNRLNNVYGIETVIKSGGGGGPPQSDSDVDLEISGSSILLSSVTEAIENKMKESQYLVDVSSDLSSEGSEIQYSVDREALARYGLNLVEISSWIRLYTKEGFKISEFNNTALSDDPIPIVAQAPLELQHINSLQDIKLQTNLGVISINSLIKSNIMEKSPSIKRKWLENTYEISANVNDIPPAVAMQNISETLENENLPNGISWRFGGDAEDIEETGTFLISAFLIALLFTVLILIWVVNSIYLLFVLLTAIIFAFPGLFLGLLITQQPFSVVMSGLATMMLTGTVINNNIILIDAFKTFLAEGMSVKEAAYRAALERLRPVTLTSATTILGLFPLVAKLSVDFLQRVVYYDSPSSQLWVQMASAFSGGLAFASVITLIITPCLLTFYKHKEHKQKS